MSQDSVYLHHDGAIANIYLNRPGAKNALDVDMWDRLLAAVERADRDTAVKVIILSGEGEAFSTGIDLSLTVGLPDDPGTGTFIADVMVEKQQRLARTAKPSCPESLKACHSRFSRGDFWTGTSSH